MRNKWVIIIILCFFIACSILPSYGNAYSLLGTHISDQIMFTPYVGFGNTTISHFNEALYQWNAAAGLTLMRRQPILRHFSTNFPSNDGSSYIYRVNTGTNDYIALTQLYYSTSTYAVLSADINLNMYHSWANSEQPGCFDVWTVFLHEAGHVAGLGDLYNNPIPVMYGYANEYSPNKRYLTQDDINGITAIYGTKNYATGKTLVNAKNNVNNQSEISNIPTALLCGQLKDYSQESLLEDSTLIVRARLLSKSAAFQIMPVFGNSPSNFTDYCFIIQDVLRGEPQSNTITVRIQGGCTNDLNLIVNDAPQFKNGEDIILFLYQPNMGSGYNTLGEYYYVLGMNQGVYYPTTEYNLTNGINYKNTYGDSFWFNDLQDTLSSMTVSIDYDRCYNEFAENAKMSLNNGFISQEEYNLLLAEADQYATIKR